MFYDEKIRISSREQMSSQLEVSSNENFNMDKYLIDLRHRVKEDLRT